MLTAEQEQAAARRDGPLALTAGAGSGKTAVLVERFVRAICEDGASPAQILAITFTERAAAELRERIRSRLLELRERDAAREAATAFVGTIHGFCARLLRAHPLPAGVVPGFAVLDEPEAERLRRLAYRQALAGFLRGEPAEAVDLVAAYGADRLQRIVADAHAALRSQGQSAPRLPLPTGETDGSRAAALIDELLHLFGQAYRARKRARAALDFDDLELCAHDLLREHDAIRSAWAERFALLMVDEFQDTNRRQLALLGLLDRGNLFTVGDELQSIYGFRHADVRLFEQRRSQLERQGATLALTHNFRSRPPILAAVDRVFGERLGDLYSPLRPAREQALSEHGAPPSQQAVPPSEHGVRQGEHDVPLSEHATQAEPIVELALTDRRGWQTTDGALSGLPEATPWRIAEARLLAARIAALVQRGDAHPGQVAVLLRSASDMPLYEAALRELGLPALAATGDFWGHRQVGDLLAYLRALANPLDELALYSTLACPLVGLSSDGLVLLARVAREHGCGAWEAIERHPDALPATLPALDARRLLAFGEWFSAERRLAAVSPLGDLLRRALHASRYDRNVLALPWGERRLANVHKLIRLARGFEAQEGRDLRGFLRHVAHMGDAFAGREAHAAAGDGRAGAVQLMTVHAAKGLEFDVVCVADLGRAVPLRAPDLIVEAGRADAHGRLGLRLRVLDDPEARPALEYEALCAESQAAQQAEEDRILYVAMTRARERLLLSGALDFERWPAPRLGGPPMSWLAPALLPDIASLVQSGERTLDVCVHDALTVRFTANRPAGEPPASAAPDWPPVGAVSASRTSSAPVEVDASALGASSGGRLAVGAASGGWLAFGASSGGRLAVGARDAAAESPLSDPDASVSYSSLVELERCGYRYYLERVLRMPERHLGRDDARDRGLRARVRGTIVHLLLQDVDFARPEPVSEDDVIAVSRRVGARAGAAERAEIVSLIDGALRTELAQRIARGRPARREHAFAFSLGAEQPLVSGVLDLLVQEQDRSMLIVDYKTDSVTCEHDLKKLAAEDYGLQRLLYALAAIEAGARQAHVAHWFLQRPQEPVLVSFHSTERDELREQLLARMAELRERGFSVSDDPHRGICLTCPGRETLCPWGKSRTSRERSPTLGRSSRVATLTL